MKVTLRLGKKGWVSVGIGALVLAAGVLGGLRSHQLAEQARLAADLNLVQKRLTSLELDKLSAEMQQTRDKIDLTTGAVVTLKNQIAIPTDSIAAGDRLYRIADATGVRITLLAAGDEYPTELAGVPAAAFPVAVTVEGSWNAVTLFVTRLRYDFTTSLVEDVDISATAEAGAATGNLRLLIYTYRGS